MDIGFAKLVQTGLRYDRQHAGGPRSMRHPGYHAPDPSVGPPGSVTRKQVQLAKLSKLRQNTYLNVSPSVPVQSLPLNIRSSLVHVPSRPAGDGYLTSLSWPDASNPRYSSGLARRKKKKKKKDKKTRQALRPSWLTVEPAGGVAPAPDADGATPRTVGADEIRHRLCRNEFVHPS